MQYSVKISFIGDISFNNRFEKIAESNENPFLAVSEKLYQSDLVVGNLECLLYGESVNTKKNPRIGTTLNALSLLNFLNIKIVTLAHNHFYDNLIDGFNKTTDFLNANNIQYLGASNNYEKSKNPLFVKINGMEFCFINYLTKDTNPNIPNDATVFANFYDKYNILKDIEDNRIKCDHLILLFHWGGRTEGYFQPDWYQRQDAKEFIDAGADLIIGGHSHTLQPYEIYKDKYIFYSLGNFCFDDVISEGQIFPWRKKSFHSLIVTIVFGKYNYIVDLIPITNKNNKVSIENESLSILNRRSRVFNIIFKNSLFWKINFLYENKLSKVFNLLFSKEYNLHTIFNKILLKVKAQK
jgi:poly-gamma-glutamate capsule biosynthesis protein CapA/YwtB (metallophosphatase superfamily)